jgi:hypothetical protein
MSAFSSSSGHTSARAFSSFVPQPAVSKRSKQRSYSITSSARASRTGDTEPEGIRGLQVYHQLVLGRLLDREVGWPLALEDTIHVGSGTLVQF